MTNIVKYNGNDSLSLMKISEEFFKSGLFPNIKSPAAAFAVVHYGNELGVTPMVSLQTMAIVKGKITMGAGVMLSIAKRNGVSINILKETDTECEIEFTKDKSTYICSFTIEDAKKAGLVKAGGAWETYPKDLLFHRATTRGLRRVCPEVVLGLYTPDEVNEIPDEIPRGTKQVEAETVEGEFIEPGPNEVVQDVIESQKPAEKPKTLEKELISPELLKAMNLQFTRIGLMHFCNEFKVYCVDQGWLDTATASFKEMQGDHGRVMMNSLDKHMEIFYSLPKYHTALKEGFQKLKTDHKRSVLMSMTSLVEDIDTIPGKITGMNDTHMEDMFTLFLTMLRNQYHNEVVGDTEKGMDVDKAIDTLDDLGMDPKVVETAKITGKEEPDTPTQEDFINQ